MGQAYHRNQSVFGRALHFSNLRLTKWPMGNLRAGLIRDPLFMNSFFRFLFLFVFAVFVFAFC